MRDLSYEKQPIGDTIRWSDVYPNIDLTVRYVHDTLKVDTIVKAPLMRDLCAKIANKQLDGNDYLTARFTVLQAAVMAEARQGGEIRDLYAEPFTINEPLLFVRDNKVIHEVRPVEAYPVDAMGQLVKGQRVTLRTAQRWQLERNAPGVAEMSVILADLANLPDGDLCIDPTTTFGGTAEDQDTLLVYNSSSYYGSTGLVYWENDDHLVFGFHVDDVDTNGRKELNKGIISATLEVYAQYSTLDSGLHARAHRVTTSWSEGTANWPDPWTTDGGDFDNPAFESPQVDLPTTDNKWFQLNVTSILKMHYSTGGLGDVGNKGFLIDMEGSTNGDLGVCFSEHGTTGYRPKLVVTYSMPTFGADAGPGNDYTQNWTMDIRQDNMRDDRLTLIRYFSGSDDDDGFVETAYENGMKVIYLIGAGDKYSSGSQTTYPTAASYATHVFNELNAISDYIDGTISNTVIAVELGNEEDGEMKWSAAGQDYNGGQSFAAYYVAARDEIKEHWPQLEIISGGSLSYHKDFQKWITNPNDIGTGARAFLCGFIDAATYEALDDTKGTYDYLPDTVAIHGYMNHYSSEDEWTRYNHPQYGTYTEWKYRAACLVESCTARGWIPNVAVTEYGYSPTEDNGYAPCIGASETSQAVYYIRSCLLNSTMCVPGINWKYSLYFHHPRDDADVGFHDRDDFPGASRAIRFVAREISCATGNSPGLCAEGSTIWSPLNTQYEGLVEGYKVYTAWCGWKRTDGHLWGAIWRYIHEWNYYNGTPTGRDFVVEGDYRAYVVQRYQFTIADGAATYQSVGNAIAYDDYSDGKTSWEIPAVDENPTFLYFYQQ